MSSKIVHFFFHFISIKTILLGLVAAVPTPDDYQAYAPAAVPEKLVFAHYMLCFAAFGEKGEHKTTACDNIYLAS